MAASDAAARRSVPVGVRPWDAAAGVGEGGSRPAEGWRPTAPGSGRSVPLSVRQWDELNRRYGVWRAKFQILSANGGSRSTPKLWLSRDK